jgi:hypothetical protein
MNPEVDQILGVSAAQLSSALAPMLPDGYPQGMAAVLSLMMALSAQEYDRGAEIRASENSDMRALFGEIAPRVADGVLRAQLESAAQTRDDSIRISALNKSNAELRRILIALQTHIEAQGGARDAEARVWDVLKRMAAGRLLKLA